MAAILPEAGWSAQGMGSAERVARARKEGVVHYYSRDVNRSGKLRELFEKRYPVKPELANIINRRIKQYRSTFNIR